MGNHSELDEIRNWKPKLLPGVRSDENKYGFPTVIFRAPSKLVEECERAYDEGLLIAALALVVTIPDVCAHITGSDYRKWSEVYLGLTNDGNKREEDRKKSKTNDDVKRGFDAMEERGVFTASDLYQLRCAVVHAGSSSINDENSGSVYTPFRVIGICINGNAGNVIESWGHNGVGTDGEEIQDNCVCRCRVELAGLIALMAKGVCKFIQEDPSRDREYSLGDMFEQKGIVDFRPILSGDTVKVFSEIEDDEQCKPRQSRSM